MTAEASKQAQALDSMTDVHKETQLDSAKLNNAVSFLQSSSTTPAEAQRNLKAIAVKQDDVDLVMAELETDRKTAETALRLHAGNVVAAIRSLL